MLLKLIAFFYYMKARNAASTKNYLDALEYLNKIPSKGKQLFYYLLRGFILEQLGLYEESLRCYDVARSLMNYSKKMTDDDINYLSRYINFGYANIYRLQGRMEESKEFLTKGKACSFKKNKIKKYILDDFPINNV